MFCANCGNELEKNTKFCPKCGNAVLADNNTTNEGVDLAKNEISITQPMENNENTPNEVDAQKSKKRFKQLFGILSICSIVVVIFLVKIVFFDSKEIRNFDELKEHMENINFSTSSGEEIKEDITFFLNQVEKPWKALEKGRNKFIGKTADFLARGDRILLNTVPIACSLYAEISDDNSLALKFASYCYNAGLLEKLNNRLGTNIKLSFNDFGDILSMQKEIQYYFDDIINSKYFEEFDDFLTKRFNEEEDFLFENRDNPEALIEFMAKVSAEYEHFDELSELLTEKIEPIYDFIEEDLLPIFKDFADENNIVY